MLISPVHRHETTYPLFYFAIIFKKSYQKEKLLYFSPEVQFGDDHHHCRQVRKPAAYIFNACPLLQKSITILPYFSFKQFNSIAQIHTNLKKFITLTCIQVCGVMIPVHFIQPPGYPIGDEAFFLLSSLRAHGNVEPWS